MLYSLNFFLLVLIILLTLIYLEFYTKYTIINKIPKIINNDKGILYIATHNYEHKDIFITFQEFEKLNNKFYMLFADKKWNHWLEPFRPKNIEFIYVKQKTVECISSKLLLGENVIMFLYYESESTGPFYIIKNTKCPLVLLKIKKEQKELKELKGMKVQNVQLIDNDIEYSKNKDNNNLIINHFNGSFKDIYVNNFMSNFTLEIKKVKYNLSKYTNCKFFIKQLKDLLYS